MALPRTFSMERQRPTRFPIFSYARIFFSQLPFVLDTSRIDVIVDSHENGLIHVANVFPDGRWRMIALLRFISRVLLVLAIPLFPIYWLILPWFRIVVGSLLRRAGADTQETSVGTERLSVPINLDKPTESSWFRRTLKYVLITPLSRLVWSLWAFNANAETFEKMYVQAWLEHYVHSRNKVVHMVSIFVDDEAVRVPVPFLFSDEGGAHCDRHTCETLLMWYSWLRVKKGFGEIVLPKRLIRIDKVKLNGGDLSLGRRIRTLEFGRNGESRVEYLRNPAKVPGLQITLTSAVMDESETEGLEFIRAWDSFAIAIIALLPLVLSLAFAGAWIAISIRDHQVDAQIATQTAFTVASYIITAGALVVALFAFLDSSSQRNGIYSGGEAYKPEPSDDKPSEGQARRQPSPPRPQPPSQEPASGSADREWKERYFVRQSALQG